MLFLTEVFFAESEVKTYAYESTLPIENKNQCYVKIVLSISTIEGIMIEIILFCQK